MIGNCENSHPDKELTYSSISIEGIQKDTFLSFNIKQVFTNSTGENTDLTYYFPNDSQFCTYETLFLVDGKEIKPNLREKDEAKHEFNEAREAGRHAMFGEDAGNGLNSFQLGNLPKDKSAEIHLKVSFLADIDENGYFFKFPLSTKYQKGTVTNEYSDKPNSFHFSLKVNTQKEMSDFKVSIDGNKNVIDSHNAAFETNEAPKKDAIFVETPIKDGDKNVAVSSDGYIAISTNPSFSGKIESNSEFYFVVDCSGSMSGARIINAVKCMRLFIQSLPIGCRFSIIKFGTSFETVLQPCDYSDENVDKALNLLTSVNARMGGTDILSPLQHISELKPQPGFVKQIFLLTDGEVDNPDVTCATALKNRAENRIFSIGLGSGADPGLIKGLAKKSGGNYIMIADEDNMNEKVITLLSSAIAPAAANISIQTDKPATEIWPSPCPSLYSNNPQSFLVKAPYSENVLISGNCSDETVDIVIPVSKCEDNLGMKQLFARYIIEDYESQILIQRDDDLRKKCIQLSLDSGVLCKFTAYVGIIFEPAPPPAENPAKRIARHQTSRRLHGSGLAPHMLGGASPLRAMRSNARVVSQEVSSIQQFNDNDEDADKEKSKDAVPKPNVDGSWNEFENMDKELVEKYGKAVAATVAAIAFIKTQFKDKLKEYALIIKKAFAFLVKQNKDVNWEEIVNKYVKV